MSSNPISDADGPELVFGLVGPLGCDLDELFNVLRDALKSVGYTSEKIHLSNLLRETTVWQEMEPQSWDKEIEHKQRIGNALREKSKCAEALAICGIRDIRRKRAIRTREEAKPSRRHAYIIRQLKHPAEVECLRRVYGDGFFLIGLYSPRERRITRCRGYIRASKFSGDEQQAGLRALDLVNTDEKEEGSYGQDTRDTFPEADLFVTDETAELLKNEVERFVDLLFGHPVRTPTRQEFLMYQAISASLRSSDLGRQVGAAIASVEGDVIAMGVNEVPKVGGGLIWDGDSPDRRDFKKYGRDPSMQHKRDLVKNLIETMQEHLKKELGMFSVDDLMSRVEPGFMKSKLMGIQEFGRPVHAEMAALLDAAMRGVAVKGHVIYVTTFPCHNCAKHIIASGVRAVVFLEPYPKSLLPSLFEDEFKEQPQPRNLHEWKYLMERSSDAVALCAYLGVAPRRYLQLFKMVERKDKDGTSTKHAWESNKGLQLPRTPAVDAYVTYVPREVSEIARISGMFSDR